MKINANISALQTARNINRTNSQVSKSLEKLSSGYKINSVQDDPTGTAMSSRVKAQLYGLRLASKNASDGVSLVQTAEGALEEAHEVLKRMRELSVQAANDTNAPEDRQKIQQEIDQLMMTIDQMADTTEFNKMKLLNGSLSNLTTISQNDEISHEISVKYMSPTFPTKEYEIDITAIDTNSRIDAAYIKGQDGKITLNNDTIEINASDSDETIQTKIRELADRYNCITDFTGAPNFNFISKESGPINLEFEGSSVTGVFGAIGQSCQIDLVSGFSAGAVVKTEGNRIIITESNGSELMIDIEQAGAGGTYSVKIEDKGSLKLQTGANEDQRISLMVPGISTDSLGLSKKSFVTDDPSQDVSLVNVKNVKGAEHSLELLDTAISKVSDMRSTLGAYQNRLEHTVKTLDINVTNTSEALSRIQDTDMALEMSNYTLKNVILQSGIAMLSQANERPQQLLQLLR